MVCRMNGACVPRLYSRTHTTERIDPHHAVQKHAVTRPKYCVLIILFFFKIKPNSRDSGHKIFGKLSHFPSYIFTYKGKYIHFIRFGQSCFLRGMVSTAAVLETSGSFENDCRLEMLQKSLNIHQKRKILTT